MEFKDLGPYEVKLENKVGISDLVHRPFEYHSIKYTPSLCEEQLRAAVTVLEGRLGELEKTIQAMTECESVDWPSEDSLEKSEIEIEDCKGDGRPIFSMRYPISGWVTGEQPLSKKDKVQVYFGPLIALLRRSMEANDVGMLGKLETLFGIGIDYSDYSNEDLLEKITRKINAFLD